MYKDTKIPLREEEDDFYELQQVVCNHTIKTVTPIEISQQCSASVMREELLLKAKTGVEKESGVVLWFVASKTVRGFMAMENPLGDKTKLSLK